MTLRLTLGLTMLAIPLGAGFLGRSPWIVPALAVPFTLGYVIGKLPAWARSWRAGRPMRFAGEVLLTFAVQAVLVGGLYLLGRGAGSLVGRVAGPDTMTGMDWMGVSLATALALCGLAVRPYGSVPEGGIEGGLASSDEGRRTFATLPVTEESFYDGRHYSHADPDGDPGVPTAAPLILSPEAVAIEEARLTIVLPPALRRLYLRQNGGSVRDVAVRTGSDDPDDWPRPFGGYDVLHPLSEVESVEFAVERYADRDDQPEVFPEGCDRLVVLSQYYRETLMLDYRDDPLSPAVRFVDFDRFDDLRTDDWLSAARSWPDFDTFFAALVRIAPTEDVRA